MQQLVQSETSRVYKGSGRFEYPEDGPWSREDDCILFEWAGYPCLVNRGPVTGSLNGYVSVSSIHPMFDKPMYDIEESFDVHGGVTFAEKTTLLDFLKRVNFELKLPASMQEPVLPKSDARAFDFSYSDCAVATMEQPIVEVAESSDPFQAMLTEERFIIGFDTSHYTDLMPMMLCYPSLLADSSRGHYHTLEEVTGYVKALAEQLANFDKR